MRRLAEASAWRIALSEADAETSSGFEAWIVDPANPLTARVQANRLWEKFFGVGIVKTSENLGVQSEWPSNPELLDWLATWFVEHGWSLGRRPKPWPPEA